MGQVIKNLGWGGDVLDARLGSASGADSNDPKFLDWDGENYVYLPGVSGNYLSVPDEAALDITGDIDIRVRVALDDWTLGAYQTFAGRRAAVSTDYSWLFGVDTANRLFMWTSSNGTARVADNFSTVALSFTDGQKKWVRVTVDVDNGSSGHTITYYTSDDGSTWAQFGDPIVNAGTTSIFAATAKTTIGAYRDAGDVSATNGKFYRAQVLNGIDGTPVLDIDCSQITSGSATSFTALTGQTVTINRSTSGRKAVAVTHPCWLFGTDDYMEVPARWVDAPSGGLFLPGVSGNYASTPDSAAVSVTGDLTVDCYARLDDWTPGSYKALVAKRNTGNHYGYQLGLATSGDGKLAFAVASATSTFGVAADSTVAVSAADGEALWVRATYDADNGAGGSDVTFYTSLDGVTWTQLGAVVTTAGTFTTFASTAPLYVGFNPVSATFTPTGTVYRARIYASADGSGSPVFDADFTGQAALATTFTEDSTNAATVTVNTSGSGYVATLVPASGYVQPTGVANFQPSSYSLLDFGASDSFTVLAVVRDWGTTLTRVVLSKKAATGAGYSLYRYNSTEYGLIASDGTATSAAARTGSFTGTSDVIAAVRNTATDALTVSVTGNAGTPVTDATTGSLANSYLMRIGRTSTNYADFEFIAAAIFRRALTSGEITTLSNYFAGRVA